MRAQYFFAIAALLAAAGVYYAFNPASAGFFPQCPFRLLTGWECPGCGSQRAIHCLLHGDVPGAFRQNALLTASIPLLLLLAGAEVGKKSRPAWHRLLHRPALVYAYLAVVLLWWVGRNLFHF